jgi:hypothetical protein
MGAKLLNFSVSEMKTVLGSLMDGHVIYRLGAKVWNPKTTPPAKVTEIDCSGFTKYLTYLVATPRVNLPAGSWHQEQWCKKMLWKVDYAKEASKSDGKIRIAFRPKTKENPDRHVWFILNGWTIESTSKGVHNGPSSLHWKARTSEAKSCYVLGQLDPLRSDAFWLKVPKSTT